MDKFKTKLKEVFSDKELYIFSIITILFFGIFCIMQYAPDTYNVFSSYIKTTTLHFFACGRFVTGAFIYILMAVFKFSNGTVYKLSYILAVACTIISLYRLNKLIKKDVKNNVLAILISTLIIINPFSLELFLYIEKGIMLLSVLLCVLAVEQIYNFFNGSKKAIIYALIFMIIANCCYQGTVGVFVVISIIYAVKYSKSIKEFIINNAIVALTYGIPAVLNFLLVRFIFANSRVSGSIILSESISKIMQGTENMLVNTYALLPKYFLITFMIILFGFIVYKSISEKSEIKEKVLEILGAIYIAIIAWFSTVAPQLLQDTSQIWFVARSSYPMAAVLGVLLFYLCMNYNMKSVVRNLLLTIVTIFFIVQFGNFMRYSIDNYIGNYMDRTITIQIKEMIEAYEKESGNKIDSIALYKDSNSMFSYPIVKATGDINIRAYAADWCVMPILKLYTNREYNLVESSLELKEKFEKVNWNYFDKEQVIFEDNVMHLCLF